MLNEDLVTELNKKIGVIAQNDIEGKVFNSHGLFKFVDQAQHFWSPQLNVSFEKLSDARTVVRGMYGPHPTVWAAFLMVNSLLGIAFFFISILAGVKYSLHQQSYLFWVLLIIFGLLVMTYVIAQIGHHMGDKQTHILHSYFESLLGENIKI